MFSKIMGTTIVFSVLAFVLVLGVSEGFAKSDKATSVQSATVTGSAIKTGEDKSCVGGNELIQKTLVLTTSIEGAASEEVTTRSWYEATGESCKEDSAAELPDASKELSTVLAKDSRERPDPAKAAAGQLRRSYCSSACVTTWGRYECWYGYRYWIDYCYNECNQYTGQYYYTYYGVCY